MQLISIYLLINCAVKTFFSIYDLQFTIYKLL